MSDSKRVDGVWNTDANLPVVVGVHERSLMRVERQEEPGIWAPILAENNELRSVVEQLRADRNRLVEQQRQLMTLLGTTSPEKLVHDLRNLLNERELFKALLDSSEL